jgi:YD repeat-containing protein
LQTLQAYGVISQKEFPEGDAADRPSYTTTTSYSLVNLGGCTPDLSGAATSGPQCCVQVWRTQTYPDRSQHRHGMCANNPMYAGTLNDNVVPHGWVIGDEVRSPDGTLMTGAYEGTPSSGQLSYQYDIGPLVSPSQCGSGVGGAIAYDQRTTWVAHLKDGIRTTATFTFGDAIDVGGAMRNTLNETASCLWLGSATSCAQGTGTKLKELDTAYQHDLNYNQRNLLRLSANTKLHDGTGSTVEQHAALYDEFPLASSGQTGLDAAYTNQYRGNATTTRSYLNPSNGTGAIDGRVYYFDNGSVQKTQNANDLAAGRFTTNTVAANFGPCASNPTVATTVKNALGYAVTTVADCYSRIPLSTTDTNGLVTCSQYDGLGRVVETAGPGDTLSALSPCTAAGSPAICYVRDTIHCATGGSTIGNGGNGATTWKEYFPFGLGGVTYGGARTVVHVKDGSETGKYSKKFIDGMARTVANCDKIDPGASDGAGTNDEACVYTTHDALGRVFQTYGPYYATDTTSVSPPAASGPYSQRCYDSTDRVTQSALVWAGGWTCDSSPPTTSLVTSTSYSTSGNNWTMTVIDPNGNQSQTLTDALGHVVELDRFRCATSSCTTASTKLVTTMNYDVAGHLLSTTNPAGNVAAMGYDGLGRKTSMRDPDMGTWLYGYDAVGNLTTQVDAKGQTISFYYDALNRLTVKDLPPAGPGREDVLNTYDGVLPTCSPMPCASSWSGSATALCCDDRDPATTDVCDPGTVTCNSVSGVCVAGTSRTVSCGFCGAGTETDTCIGGNWTTGACTGGGACAPGSTQQFSCGNCGIQTDTCNASCNWTTGSCQNQGACAPSSTRQVSCGNCGTETDTCSTSCQWTAGSCTGQGVCAPSSTRQQACGQCGTEPDTCTSSCQWTAGACTGSASTTQSCSPSSLCWGTQACTSNGTWGACANIQCDDPTGGCQPPMICD